MNELLKVIVIGICFQLCVNGQQEVGEEAELRNKIRSLQEENSRLISQNHGLDLVISGVKQICSLIKSNDCTCRDEITAGTKNQLPEHSPDIKINHVSTTGMEEGVDHVNVSLTYAAPDEHSAQVMVLFENNALWRTAREITKHDDGTYTLTVTLREAEVGIGLRILRFTINTDTEHVNVQIENSEVYSKQGNEVPEIRYDLFRMNTTVDASSGPNTTLRVMVNENIEYLGEQGQIELYTIGEKDNEPTVAEDFYPVSENIHVNVAPSGENGMKEMTITLTNGVARNGGTLTLFVRHNIPDVPLVDKIDFGLTAKIVSDDVFKDGRIIALQGPLSQPSAEYIAGPKQSIICGAMAPNLVGVAMIRVNANGKEEILQTETIYSDFMSKYIAYTLDTFRAKEPGEYKCRAWNAARRAVTKTVHVNYLEPSRFIPSETGVQRNASEHVTISCKASGFPPPELRFRLQHEHGDELSSEEFRVSEVTMNKSNQKLLTIPRSFLEESGIDTIICGFRQADSKGTTLGNGLRPIKI